jgi:GxxExxY protein
MPSTNELSYGFREEIYENSLAIELQAKDFEVSQQHEIMVYYHGREVGKYYADLLVDNLIIIEIKAARQLVDDHEAQLLNYLKATWFEVGLLFNFGIKPEFRRKAFTNDRTGHLRWTKPD